MAGELILIADDQELVLLQTQAVLQGAGYRTLVAGDGAVALALVQAHSPDLLLSDIRLGEMDGLQLWTQAREARPDLLGILMTSHSSTDSVIKALHLGLGGFLLKPFGSQELLKLIEEVFERRTRQEEAARLRWFAPFQAAQPLTQDTTELAQPLVESLAHLVAADYCALFLTDSTDPATLKTVACWSGPKARGFTPRTFPIDRLTGRARELGRTVNLRRSQSASANTLDEVVPGVITALPIQTAGQFLGVLLLSRAADRSFQPGELNLLETLAIYLAARLLPATPVAPPPPLSSDTRLQRLANGFISGQEQERQSLNERLQSDVLPALTASRKNVQAYLQKVRPSSATDLMQAEERLQNLIKEVKRFTTRLYPANLAEFGLSAALRLYSREQSEDPRAGCPILFKLTGEEVPRLESQVELPLFRACQSALDYACRRAAGTGSAVTLAARVSGPVNKGQLVEFEIIENTATLLPDLDRLEVERPDLWLALLIAQEEAALAGATYQFERLATGGSLIRIGHTLPVLDI